MLRLTVTTYFAVTCTLAGPALARSFGAVLNMANFKSIPMPTVPATPVKRAVSWFPTLALSVIACDGVLGWCVRGIRFIRAGDATVEIAI